MRQTSDTALFRKAFFEAGFRQATKEVPTVYSDLRKRYQETGDAAALETAQALVRDQQNITLGDKERLLGSIDPSAYYGLASDYNNGSARYLSASHTHRWLDGSTLKTTFRDGASARHRDHVATQPTSIVSPVDRASGKSGPPALNHTSVVLSPSKNSR